MSSPIIDKKTIGLTPEGEEIIEQVMTKNLFNDKMDAAKFAMALAIRKEVQPGQLSNSGTIWNVGSFDTDNQIKNMIPVFYPGSEAPYRAAEYLIDAGLRLLKAELENGTFDAMALMCE
jgi:hypothetical protein